MGSENDPVLDEALCVRGGLMGVSSLLKSAARAKRREGAPGISVFCGHPESTVADLVGAGDIPHRQIRVSTAGAIRSAGFTVRRQGRWPHCTVDMSPEADEASASRLAACFGEPELNPRPR